MYLVKSLKYEICNSINILSYAKSPLGLRKVWPSKVGSEFMKRLVKTQDLRMWPRLSIATVTEYISTVLDTLQLLFSKYNWTNLLSAIILLQISYLKD